ncbi:pepsin-like aspartic protease [Aspergillus clavatus NRRL 1]|uniref:Aspartic endopeptidase, putative n=1 Tax=Aspergillus clavatus (strain ATCC 1007 / CBS 513.65 / DSM 816 / NCTC 3887 / NRRL 1 / QM 1276 / 107) TaxID=344612 RepID=A1CMJ2_ASPCL|nr:aspartic endopeptidase, putative [Aspergillus clavatus NRRL 1]EAW08779.1 aspartic endopeptidase, putative [Aspergillus clavatus NRRL 1]
MSSKIHLTPNPHYHKSGPKSYVHLLRKYRFTTTKPGPYVFSSFIHQTGTQYTRGPVGGRARTQHRLRKRVPGSDQLVDLDADDAQNEAAYLARVSIGTPEQRFNVAVDSAVGGLWVWSTNLSAETIAGHRAGTGAIFDGEKSSTFSGGEGVWRVEYGDGASAGGIVGREKIVLGEMTIQKQEFGLADVLSAQFARGTADGVLGLGFGSLGPDGPRGLVEAMCRTGDVSSSVELFTVRLGSSGAEAEESFCTFGFVDEETVKIFGGEVYYTPIDDSQGFWMFDSGSAVVNGKTVAREGNKAIVDSGTMLTLVDDETCQRIYDAIPGAYYDEESQGYLFPSDTAANELPVVSLAVGERQFVVRKEDLGFAEAKPGYAYGGIQSRGSMKMDVLGGTFLMGLYAIFDVGNLRFGAVQHHLG